MARKRGPTHRQVFVGQKLNERWEEENVGWRVPRTQRSRKDVRGSQYTFGKGDTAGMPEVAHGGVGIESLLRDGGGEFPSDEPRNTHEQNPSTATTDTEPTLE